MAEKQLIVKSKDQQLDTLNDRLTALVKDKERLMRDYAGDLHLRDTELDSLRLAHDEDLAKHQREKATLR